MFTACRISSGWLLRSSLTAITPSPVATQKFVPLINLQHGFKTMLISPMRPQCVLPKSSILLSAAIAPQAQPIRSLTKFSLKKGKRKSVKAVLKRFKRLDWGGWIRTRQGRHKKMWKKTGALKRRLRQHVIVNATQSWLLDKMVTKFWRRPKHYVDDPYRPYHSRDEFETTRRIPIKY